MSARPARRPRLPPLRSLALLAASAVVCFGLAEGVVRVVGARPFEPPEPRIRVEPGGRYQRADERLGYRHLPGRFRITFPDGWTWTATHRDDTLRITRPLAQYDEPLSDRQIWIFGCSFTHGWGLNDEETFPWRLQLRTRAAGFEVVNFGTGGYGTLQSLLQFRDALESRSPPEVVVLAYAGFHDMRNTMLREWTKANYSYQRFGPTGAPYARLDWRGRLRFGFSEGYGGLAPLRYSAFLHLLERSFNRFEAVWRRSHAVSERLVELFASEAEEAGSEFVVVGISPGSETAAMIDFARKAGIVAGDISLPLEDPRYRIPFDGHPNALAAEVFAGRLYAILDRAGLLAPDS